MSESSLPPFGPARKQRPLPGLSAISPRNLLAHLGMRLRARLRKAAPISGRSRRKDRAQVGGVLEPSSSLLEARARELLRDHLSAQAANIERAERLASKASRLEEAGTPSESARNRADRARREVTVGIDALRARFTREISGEVRSQHAFDRALRALSPGFASPARPADDV